MAHPVLTFEEDLRMALKQLLASLRPVRAAFQGLMFSKPAPDAEAQLFTFNGVTFGTRFFGMVRTQPVEWKPKAQAKPRIIAP